MESMEEEEVMASRIMRTVNSELLFNCDMMSLFGGGFPAGIISLSFWIDLVAFSTCARQRYMMLIACFIQRSAISLCRGQRRQVVYIAILVSACAERPCGRAGRSRLQR